MVARLSQSPALLLMSARLADLMEQHQEELATIEALDAGAVYTLALKTHVGMSIQTFRYFAGWCDKIQVGFELLCVHACMCGRVPGEVAGRVASCQARCQTATTVAAYSVGYSRFCR